MLAVGLGYEQALEVIAEDLGKVSVAAVNSTRASRFPAISHAWTEFGQISIHATYSPAH